MTGRSAANRRAIRGGFVARRAGYPHIAVSEPTPTVLPDPPLEPRRPDEPPTVDIPQPPDPAEPWNEPEPPEPPDACRAAHLSFRPATISSGRGYARRMRLNEDQDP